MPELLVDFITSLDGYGAAEGWPGWWGLQGPEYLAWLDEQLEADHAHRRVLMGANTYRLMSGFASEGEPGTDLLAGLSKIVFSTTLKEPLAWANTELVARDAAEAVREMKGEEGGRPMSTIGSLTLCRSLLKAGLVDRFRVVVFPVITGSTGRDRIYDGYPDVSLDPVSSRTFDGRLQLLEYVPTVLAGPPGARAAPRRQAPPPRRPSTRRAAPRQPRPPPRRRRSVFSSFEPASAQGVGGYGAQAFAGAADRARARPPSLGRRRDESATAVAPAATAATAAPAKCALDCT